MKEWCSLPCQAVSNLCSIRGPPGPCFALTVWGVTGWQVSLRAVPTENDIASESLKIYRHVISQKWINTWPVLWRELFCDVNCSIALVGFQFEFSNKISWGTNRFCRKPTYLQQHCFRTQARCQIMRLRKWYPWYSITLRHTSKHCEAIAYLKSFLRIPNSHFCGFKDVNIYVAWCCRPPEL